MALATGRSDRTPHLHYPGTVNRVSLKHSEAQAIPALCAIIRRLDSMARSRLCRERGARIGPVSARGVGVADRSSVVVAKKESPAERVRQVA